MNEIAKQSASDKLQAAIVKEGVTTKEAGALIGIKPCYISMFKNPKLWDNLGNPQWEKLLKFINSGYSIRDYLKHHPEQAIDIKDKKVKLPKDMVDTKKIIIHKGSDEIIDPVASALFQQSIDNVKKEQEAEKQKGAPFDEAIEPPEHIASGDPADDEITNIDDLFENGQLDQDKVSNYLTDAYNKERAKLVGKIANNDQIILNFIKTYSTKVKTSPGTAYYFLPFWIEVTDNNAGYKFVSLNNIPEDLKKAIKILRGE